MRWENIIGGYFMVIYLNANTIEKYSFEAQNRDNVGHYG